LVIPTHEKLAECKIQCDARFFTTAKNLVLALDSCDEKQHSWTATRESITNSHSTGKFW